MEKVDELRYGTKQDVKNILKTMDETLLKTLLNVMLNALGNSAYSVNITQKYKNKLKPYMKIYKKLLDKKIPLKKKYSWLRKSGHEYIPTFLQILGDDVYDCIPTGKGKRVPLDCPLCNKKGLIRLANHLTQKHNIRGIEKKELLKKARDASDTNYDTGDESIASTGTRESDESDY